MKKIVRIFMISALLLLTACGSPAADNTATNSNTASNENQNQNQGATQSSEPKVMKLSVVTSKERSLTKGLEKFAEIVEQESGGMIKAEVYADGQLGGDREALEGLQLGTIEGTTVSTGPIAQFAPRFNIFDLPFLFPNEEIAYEVLDGPFGAELLADLPAQGMIGLNYWENGFRHVTNNVREIKSADDIKGLKLRTLENDLHIDMWKELGANPTPIAFTELFVALQQGVVDGQENPTGNVTSSKFYEVQKYLTKTGHIYNASPFLISKKFWDSLTDEEKEIIQKAADQARDYQRELNRQEDESSTKEIIEKGMVVTELSAEEKQKFFEKVQPVYDKYTPQIGEEIVKKLLEEIESKK